MTGNGDIVLSAWEPNKILRKISSHDARYSRGFLRSRPEKWLPSFGSQWLSLFHSLGIEARLVEIKPGLGAPPILDFGYAGTIDDEPVSLFADRDTIAPIAKLLAGEANSDAAEVVVEYLARRFLTSLGLAWSGPEASIVRFNSEMRASENPGIASIRCAWEVGGNQVVVWIGIGKALLDKLDGLWRRQVRSSSKSLDGIGETRVELVQLAVPPSMLVDYMKSGSVIDLEIRQSDQVVLRHGGKAWLHGRMLSVDGRLGIEIQPGPAVTPALPDGTTRLGIEFGAVTLDPTAALELSQPGAIWDTGLSLVDRVQITINSEKVADATLALFEGRFAITVD